MLNGEMVNVEWRVLNGELLNGDVELRQERRVIPSAADNDPTFNIQHSPFNIHHSIPLTQAAGDALLLPQPTISVIGANLPGRVAL
ncbi:MAG: hypothetical protein ABI718_01445 [Acidobacteriota bacterium]